jgi:predicted kinase
MAVPAVFFLCTAEPEIVVKRLDQRRGDASDANIAIYQKVAERWEALGPSTQSTVYEIATTSKELALTRALHLLSAASVL